MSDEDDWFTRALDEDAEDGETETADGRSDADRDQGEDGTG